MTTSETNPFKMHAVWPTAQAQAEKALGVCEPNPRVGCVLVTSDGKVAGEGSTQRAGGPHAEVMALRDARGRGVATQGGTAYVTLEPCSHHGRTPPCCDALIQAGVAKVVIATLDPNPLVAGQGKKRLQAAGIEVEVAPTDSTPSREARELNVGFFSRMVRGTPWVRMKTAASLDGTTALSNGVSQWITGPEARTDGHTWRARACAVLTGIGTVLEDDPRLDVRLVQTPRQPHLVIVDSRLETPASARLFQAGGDPIDDAKKRQIWIYCAQDHAERRAALEQQGATVIHMPGSTESTLNKVDLAAMLRDLGQREVNEVHVEAGHKLNGSLVREGLVDEFLVYLAPKLLGTGLGMAHLDALTRLEDGVSLRFHAVERIGDDLRILARTVGHDDFLHREVPAATA
jgi:diaminohydroxyphosphoribosylaminopyrimidine deaminase/5-amino-6-(5-phosphoribosylamino)uracil reductase